ncbi:hypothetical protein ACROYT_G033102 [Oculina patagonica]
MLLSLLVIVLMTSSVVAERLENKNGSSGRTLSSKNNTRDECNQDVTGIRRVVKYFFNIPTQQCYRQFFVGGLQPVGLRKPNYPDIRYICQPPTPTRHQDPQQTYYATMFDEYHGIAVFSAYTLTKKNAVFKTYQGQPPGWCPTPGILRQGSDGLYRSHFGSIKYQKGHLAPKFTLSSDRKRLDSTYSYTNAVPQCPRFNAGQWSKIEDKVRIYAQYICTQPNEGQQPGTLYLLTGTSFVSIKKGGKLFHPKIKELDTKLDKTATIDIPNSLWTAGCCVRPNNNAESFAVIGNNVQNKKDLLRRRITVKKLQEVLAAGVIKRNIGGPSVNLFPGNAACRNNDSKNFKL